MKGYTQTLLGVGGGLNKDQQPQHLDGNTWSNIHNLRMDNKVLVPAQGYSKLFNPAPQPPENILSVVRKATPSIFMAGGSAIHENTNTVWSDVSRAVGGAYSTIGAWQSTVLNGCLFFNNGVDTLQVMEAADLTFKDSASVPATLKAEVFRGFNNYLFALNLTEGVVNLPQSLRWSDPADPGTEPPSWDVTDPTTQSGQVVLADTDGALVDGMQLRDKFIIYKTDAVYSCQFIGGIFVFSFQKIISDRGLLSLNCVQQFEQNHFCVGFDDIYIHDGLQAQSISDNIIKDFFFTDLDQAYVSSVFVCKDQKNKEVWVCYPNSDAVGGACNKALVWSWVYNTWSTRDIPNLLHATTGVLNTDVVDLWDAGPVDTWDLGGLQWDSSTYSPANTSLVGASKTDDELYEFNDSVLFNGSSFEFSMQKDSYNLGEASVMKYINHITPEITGDGALSISYGRQNTLNEAITWSTATAYTLGEYRSYTRQRGRFISLKLSGNTSTAVPTIGKIGVHLTTEGEK